MGRKRVKTNPGDTFNVIRRDFPDGPEQVVSANVPKTQAEEYLKQMVVAYPSSRFKMVPCPASWNRDKRKGE